MLNGGYQNFLQNRLTWTWHQCERKDVQVRVMESWFLTECWQNVFSTPFYRDKADMIHLKKKTFLFPSEMRQQTAICFHKKALLFAQLESALKWESKHYSYLIIIEHTIVCECAPTNAHTHKRTVNWLIFTAFSLWFCSKKPVVLLDNFTKIFFIIVQYLLCL